MMPVGAKNSTVFISGLPLSTVIEQEHQLKVHLTSLDPDAEAIVYVGPEITDLILLHEEYEEAQNNLERARIEAAKTGKEPMIRVPWYSYEANR